MTDKTKTLIVSKLKIIKEYIWSDIPRPVQHTYKCTCYFNFQHPGRPSESLDSEDGGFSFISSTFFYAVYIKVQTFYILVARSK